MVLVIVNQVNILDQDLEMLFLGGFWGVSIRVYVMEQQHTKEGKNFHWNQERALNQDNCPKCPVRKGGLRVEVVSVGICRMVWVPLPSARGSRGSWRRKRASQCDQARRGGAHASLFSQGRLDNLRSGSKPQSRGAGEGNKEAARLEWTSETWGSRCEKAFSQVFYSIL